MKKHNCVWGSVLLIASIATLAGCGKNAAAEEVAVKAVRAQTASEEIYHINLDYQGYVAPKDTKKLSFGTNGKVQAVFVQQGQQVQSGDILMKLDTETLETTIANEEIKLQSLKDTYETNIRAAQMNSDQQKKIKDSMTALYNAGDISRQEYDNVVFAYNNASNDLNLLLKKRDNDILLQERLIDNYRKQVEDSNLVAPSDGYITSVSVKADEMVSYGLQAVFMQSEERVINIGVSVDDYQLVSTGMTVAVSTSNRELKGRVSRVELAPDSSANTYTVEIVPEETDLPIGTLVEVKIPLETKRGVFVPFSAIVSSNGVNYIYLLEEHGQNGPKTIVKSEIKASGVIYEDRILAENVEPGQVFVLDGVKNIKENDLVVIAE